MSLACQTTKERAPEPVQTAKPVVSGLIVPSEATLARSSLQTLQSLVETYPDHALVHFYLGEAYRRQGHFEQALPRYEKTLSIDVLQDAARFSRAFTLIRLHRYAEARARLEDDLRLYPGEPMFHHLLVRLLVASPDDQVRDGQKAETHIETLLAGGLDVGLAETVAMFWAEHGQFDKAREAQQRALEMVRESGMALPAHFLTNLQRYVDGLPCRLPWPDDDPIFTRPTYLRLPPVPIKETSPWMRPGLAMTERLAQIARTAEPSVNIYLNEARAARLAQGQTDVDDLNAFFAKQPQYCVELLRAGQSERAIEELERFLKMIEANHLEFEGEKKYWLLHNLAVAHLRLGEQENCLLNHSADSCIFPIRPGGVHQRDRGSKAAVKVLEAILDEFTEDLSSRWLLNIAYMTLGEYPEKVPERWLIPPERLHSKTSFPRFPDKAGALGIDSDSLAGGSVLEDFDNDGLLDLVVSSWGLDNPIRFFRNRGDGGFEDVTEKAGLAGLTSGLNMVSTDYDNDGFVDIFVLRGAWLEYEGEHPNSLLRNNGDGSFTDVTERAGVLSFHPTQTATWLDYNNDGWLDLFIGNETTGVDPHPCELYHNNGDGTFSECAAEAGVDHLGFVKGVTSGDYDNDGRTDLYLSRMNQANVLLRNMGPRGPKGEWRFEDVTAIAGVAEPQSSFPTWFWDYDNDGRLDLFVSDYYNADPNAVPADFMGRPHPGEHARLYRNNGNGTFTDVAGKLGLDHVLVGMGANFGDLDNDGYLDFYVGTGKPDLAFLIPNRMFRNDRGASFQDISDVGGFGHLQKGHAVSFGDIDNDGDQDVHITMGGAYSGDNYRNALF